MGFTRGRRKLKAGGVVELWVSAERPDSMTNRASSPSKYAAKRVADKVREHRYFL
jgi:hypothetical protein